MEQSAIELGLDTIRSGLATDGFRLQFHSIRANGAVEVVLEALPEACFECLVPDEMLLQIIENAIRDQDPSLDHVLLTKVGFNGDGE